jgi:hypothetical protein
MVLFQAQVEDRVYKGRGVRKEI